MGKKRVSVLGLATVLIIGGFWLLWTTRSRSDGARVHRANGGSVVQGGKVLVAGRTLQTGEEIRVMEAPLYLVSGPNRVQLASRSRLRVERILSDNQLQFGYHQGAGKTTVESGPIVHRWQDRVLRQTAGTLEWKFNGRELTLLVNEEFEGSWRQRENTESKITVETGKKTFAGLKLPETRPGWHRKVGSIVEFGKFQDQLKSYLKTNGQPENLLQVAGHWPRDSWGNLFLLVTTSDGLRLRSAGPDERMFTADDRTAAFLNQEK